MNRLIIARHGNTFESGEEPRRVGARTDLPLTGKGCDQARAIGQWLRTNDIKPSAAFCSRLQRTRDTAQIALIEAGHDLFLQEDPIFDEVDYGPDENRPEAEVIARLGSGVLQAWDEQAIVPPGWQTDPEEIIANWLAFGERIIKDYPGCTVLVVTSNGIARFAPHLTGNFEDFSASHNIKLATGALGVMEFDGNRWSVTDWNIRP